MKRLISAVLALTLMGTAAASAQPFRGGHEFGNDRGYHRDYRGNWGRRDEGAAFVGLGVGLLALAAIASAHNNDHRDDRGYSDGYYGR